MPAAGVRPRGPRTSVLPRARRPRTTSAVLAGLVNDGSAGAVAAAAVAQAVEREVPVRFVQVRRPGVLPGGPATADPATPDPAGDSVDEHVDEATFRAVVRALSRHDELRAVFEAVVGDPVTVLAARSRDAGLLVVARDRADARPRVADALRRRAACPVLVVADDVDSGPGVPS